MAQLGCMLRTGLMALGAVMFAGGLAVAQTAPVPAAPKAQAPALSPKAQAPAPKGQAAAASDQNPGPDQTASSGGQQDETAESVPILAVTSVEILHSAHNPDMAVIAARGLTTTDGWQNGTLVPLTSGTPADGVLDLVFVAQAPDDASAPESYGPIQAVLPIPDNPFKAVRVRSATNTLTLKDVNGYVEAKGPAETCGPCVGKQFVAKGATAPAGVADDDTVHEEDLPANSRILKPTDGITDMRSNPNRLTIVIGEDGRIVDAIWD
jgi:hypothetical protein